MGSFRYLPNPWGLNVISIAVIVIILRRVTSIPVKAVF
jgi:hypothetical protein